MAATCTMCNTETDTKFIPPLKTTSVETLTVSSVSSQVYTGKAITPTVTVKDGKKALKVGTHYTVTYQNNTKIGTASITIKGVKENGYVGSKVLNFSILPGVTSKIDTVTSSSTVKLSWKAVPGATGYKVYLYNASTKKYSALKTTTATSYTATKLKSGTQQRFAVRAYTKADGKACWAAGYKTVTVTTNPGTPTLKVTAGSKKAALSWNRQTGATGYVVYMSTSGNGKYSKIAALKGNTKVSFTKTGLTKGKTYYFKVSAYTTVNGKNVYGDFSTVKAVKVK